MGNLPLRIVSIGKVKDGSILIDASYQVFYLQGSGCGWVNASKPENVSICGGLVSVIRMCRGISDYDLSTDVAIFSDIVFLYSGKSGLLIHVFYHLTLVVIGHGKSGLIVGNDIAKAIVIGVDAL